MINWRGWAKRWPSLWLVGVLMVLGVGAAPPFASADDECASTVRIFAVDAGTGRLSELPVCRDEPGFGSVVEVDPADWRAYTTVFSVRAGEAAILYAVTTTGELWWWRQEAAGVGLSEPRRVADSVNWQGRMVFASGSGYLHVEQHGSVRTFRHQEWTTGGAVVTEEPDLFTKFAGPELIGLATDADHAVGAAIGRTFQVWRRSLPKRGPATAFEDEWFQSGTLPAGVRGVVGDEHRLFVLDPAAGVAMLRQPRRPPADCLRHITLRWEVAATAPGGYSRVVAPVWQSRAEGPVVRAKPTLPNCNEGEEATPWEWQGPWG